MSSIPHFEGWIVTVSWSSYVHHGTGQLNLISNLKLGDECQEEPCPGNSAASPGHEKYRGCWNGYTTCNF